MKLRHFSISQQGDSHIRSGKNCQDYSSSISVLNQKLNIELGIAAIADGVGSCDYSEVGSQIAVTTVLEVLKKELASLDEVSNNTVLPILKKAYQQANERIEQEADTRELPFLLFDTTLTVTVLTDDGTCFIGHIGDDGVVALMTDGTYSMVTNRIEGEEANSVFPLSSTNYWTFGVVKKKVAALALMTDGLLDKSVGTTRMKNRVYYPFFKPMFENIMETDQDVIDLRAYWDEYLGEKSFREGYAVTDDITLAVIQLPSILKNVKPVPFDELKWREDSEKARQEIEEALSEPATSSTSKTANEEQPEKEPDASETNTSNDKSENVIRVQTQSSSGTANQQTSIPKVHRPSGQNLNQNQVVHAVNPTQVQVSHNKAQGQQSSVQSNNTSDARAKTPGGASATNGSSHNVNIGSSRSKSTQSGKKILNIAISVFAVLCMAGIGILAHNIGYNAGLTAGKQQEQDAAQQKIIEMQQAHEGELEEQYNSGYQAALSLPTKEPEIVAQQPINAPEQFIISRGQKGEIVKTIQKKLRSKGWNIETDGDYGKLTEKAVREFQLLNNLPATGEVDILTFWTLSDEKSMGSQKNDITETPMPIVTPEPSLDLIDGQPVQAEMPTPENTEESMSAFPTIESFPEDTFSPPPAFTESPTTGAEENG